MPIRGFPRFKISKVKDSPWYLMRNILADEEFIMMKSGLEELYKHIGLILGIKEGKEE